MAQNEKAYLILGDGTVFEGSRIGVSGEIIGEAVFTTVMGGYMETITDPCYYGQIVVQTFPLIGNYGTIRQDKTTQRPVLSGYVVRELCQEGSNFLMESEFNDYLIENGVVGISGIDTRELTRKLRENGTTNAMITCNKKNIEQKLKLIRSYKVTDAVASTSTKEIVYYGNERGKKFIVWDFGDSEAIIALLCKRGYRVIRVPFSTKACDILSLKPAGVVLSGGGGNPASEKEIIKEIVELAKNNMAIFAIGLGHQLLALAMGGKTKKLKYGHRGANQPVKDIESGRVYITNQNHSYVVVPSGFECDTANVIMINLNDKTCEGLEYISIPAISVQFQLESFDGPQSTEFLLDRFIKLTGGIVDAKK